MEMLVGGEKKMAYDYNKIKAHNLLMAKARIILKNRHLEEFLQIVKELEKQNEKQN
jgi:hypothetical protein